MQLLKEILFPAIQDLKDCLRMAQLMLANIDVKQGIVNDDKYKFLFSVEEVNKLVLAGMPFRDAYKKIGMDIEQGNYKPETSVSHTHEGSIGNLCLPEITAMMENVIAKFNFKHYNAALNKLVS
jgi:argininosuccinate lyase